jgi:hypothetical protein
LVEEAVESFGVSWWYDSTLFPKGKRTFHTRQMSDTKDPTVADGVNVAHADDTKEEKAPEKVATIREVKDLSTFISFLAMVLL